MTTLKPAGRRGGAPAWEQAVGRGIQERLPPWWRDGLFETCLLCHDAAITTFHSRDRDTLQCECTACRIVWFGTRVCANHYHILWPGTKAEDTTDADVVTIILGAAPVPCPVAADRLGFRRDGQR
jgi:hypothetical protein